jgi:uncharacterized protein
MNAALVTLRDQVERLCREHSVRKLSVFGSAAVGTFNPDKSDFDFLVEFQEMGPVAHKNAYFGLLAGLESLFGRHVDLVEPQAVRNPFVKDSMTRAAETIYAAA